MAIYLYKKTHNTTGLQYLGQTTKDPQKYKGSGVWWRRHIKKHGYDVTTEVLKILETYEEVSYWGNYYSVLWNVVESTEWANLIPEYGYDNSVALKKFMADNPDHYRYQAEKQKENRWWNNGVVQVLQPSAPDASYKKGRLKFNNVGALLGSETQRGKIWIRNETHEMMISPDQDIPEGYAVGRLDYGRAGNPNEWIVGSKWYNNGIISTMAKVQPDGWLPGRIICKRNKILSGADSIE